MKRRANTFWLEHRAAIRLTVGCMIFGALYCVFTLLTGIGIPCIFREITGLHCPGCGVSRFFLHLVRFDFIGAISQNLAIAILFPLWILVVMVEFFWNPTALQRGSRFNLAMQLAVGILLIVFGILRNLPGFEFLLPH